MSQLLSILAFAFSFFVCSAIYTIVYRRRQKKAKEELTADKPILDDTSYIQEVQHLSRIFTHIDNEAVITRYAETLIRRTFSTPDAMRPAKPVAVQ